MRGKPFRRNPAARRTQYVSTLCKALIYGRYRDTKMIGNLLDQMMVMKAKDDALALGKLGKES